MVDTSKLLDAVEKQKTESASLRELVKGLHQALVESGEKLADAIAKLDRSGADIADLQRVQTEIDKAATDLSLDDQDVKDVLAANVKPEVSPTGGGSGGGSTDTGAGGTAQPLPGTGVEPAPADQPAPTDPNAPQNPS